MVEFPVDVVFKVVDNVSGGASSVQSSLRSMGGQGRVASKDLDNLGGAAKIAAGVMIRDLARDSLRAVTSAATEASDAFQGYEETLVKIVGATSAVGEEAVKLRATLSGF